MSLSKLAEACAKCPYVKTCRHKQMEALAFMANPSAAESTIDVTAPIMRETRNVVIDDDIVAVYKDDIIKAIREAIYSDISLRYGA